MRYVNVVVCIKQVIDPEAPPAGFKIDYTSNKVIPPLGAALVISPYDEQAVEAALRLKDTCGGNISVVSLGKNLIVDVLKKVLAMGVDNLILIENEAFAKASSWSTAYALTMAIKKLGAYDLVLCGRQASDTDAGQVGSGIAEILGLPSVTLAKKIEIKDGKVKVERVTTDGYEVVEVKLPAVITVSHETGEPRYPTIKGIIAAKKKEPTIWKLADIGIEPNGFSIIGPRPKLLKLFQPVSEGKCEFIEGETPEEVAVNLALKLREAKIL